MSTQTSATSLSPDLAESLAEEGEKEYRRLIRSLRMARGSFFLFPIESDFPNALRDALLARLNADLTSDGLHLRVAELTREQWNIFDSPGMASPVTTSDVVALVGLEETPGIVLEAGAKPTRPPALALLNSARETLHRCAPAPMLVWCPPYAYTALMEHAPDFFDHYTGLFQFMDAAPVTSRTTLFPLDTSKPEHNFTLSKSIGSRAALEFYERQVATHPDPTPERAHVLLGLADALRASTGPDYVGRLEQARVSVKEALSLLSPGYNPYEWGSGQNKLGMIMAALPTGNRAANLRRAIDHFQAALSVCNQTNLRTEWATTQNNLGLAYAEMPRGNKRKNLHRAIASLQASLTVFTKDELPEDWARAQSNLGRVYLDLPNNDAKRDLEQATTCLQAALTVFTEDNSPIGWAKAQNNLGIAYSERQSSEGDENMRQAISCFEATLRVYDATMQPDEWASAQNNLGSAYIGLSTGNRGENLRRAITCLLAALTVYTKDEYPADYARAQWNLALALLELGNKMEAINLLELALQGYRTAGFDRKVQQIETMLNRLSQDV